MKYLLLILLNIVHWACDYTHLSTAEMLKAKAEGYPPLPILKHAFRHAAGMAVILFFFTSIEMVMVLYMFQLFTHYMIDTLKGRMNVWFPSLKDPSKKFHWYVFGADQLLHQLVIITMVYYV